MIKKIEKVVKVIAIFSVIWFLGSVILHKRCNKPLQEPTKNAYLLPSESYQPPLVKVPFFTKDRTPVSKKNLPIRKRDVKTTIVVKNPVPGAKDITIIVDKKGKIYKSKDTPKDVEIKVTEWKPKLFDIKPRLGYSLIYQGQAYHCLSLNVLRVGKFYAGGEAGVSLDNKGLIDGYLLGVSGKYRFLTLDFFGKTKIGVLATLGWNFLDKKTYVGISIGW